MHKLMKTFAISFMLVLLFSTSVFANEQNSFKDVSPKHPNYTAIEYMAKMDFISDEKSDFFYPDNPITLNEFATMLVKTFETTDKLSTGALPISFNNGWISMYTASQPPESNIKRAAVYQSALTAAGVDVYTESRLAGWRDYTNVVANWGLCDKDVNMYSTITRAEVAELLFTLSTKSYKLPEKPEVLNKIKIENTTSQNIGDFVWSLSLIPESILDKFNENGWTLKIDNAALNKYNYENKTTAIGLCSYEDKIIYTSIPFPLIHEFGHFIDYASDNSIGLNSLYLSENKKFEKFIGHGIPNSREYFAEFFESFILNQNNNEKLMELEKECPLTFKYFKNLQSNNWGTPTAR